MNRFLKVVFSVALIAGFAACKDDDSTDVAPPRDYTLQYADEKIILDQYLHNHYIASVDADMNVDIQPLAADDTEHESIWDQTEYPLQNKMVNSNGVNYTVYYLVLREGVGESPTVYDNIFCAYRGTLLNGTQFDYLPFPQNVSSLSGTIEGWREIIPLFKEGVYNDFEGNPNPAAFTDFGAGVMFLPSGLAYYNNALFNVPSYSPMVFSFKLLSVERGDADGDGIYTTDETIPGVSPEEYDTDGDGKPNYLDVDDDNDGYSTRSEITDPATGSIYDFANIPSCATGNGMKKHLNSSCH